MTHKERITELKRLIALLKENSDPGSPKDQLNIQLWQLMLGGVE